MSKKHRKRKPAPSRAQPSRRYDREEQSRKQIPDANTALMTALVVVRRLQKYGPDLAAVLLLALALLTLLGLTGLSSGAFIDPWIGVLRSWLGWGAFLVPVTAGWAGAMLLARNLGRIAPLKWGRVIAAEGAAFALLGLLNLFNNGHVALAVAGGGGGLVGWGISLIFARVFPPPADGFALGALFLLGLFFAADVTADRLARLWTWLQSQTWETPADRARASAPPESASPLTPAPVVARDSAPDRKPKPKISADERVRVPVDTAAAEGKVKQKKRDRRLPSIELLDQSDLRRPAQKDIDETASIIVKTLKEFGVPVSVVGAKVGPSVTQYQVEPGFVEKAGPDGVSKQYKMRVSQISALADDLALALSANTLRIEAPVPGESYVGVEVPNRRTSIVSLRPVMESEGFQRLNSPLSIALGRDVSGAAVSADLGAMPHLLIAGTTGSGKSVCITAITTCLVANNTPDDLRLVMIDPKMVELVRFNGLPHLYGKVETEIDRMIGVLRWVTREMDRRYKLFESLAVRNLDTYNTQTARKKDAERLPRIVVLIDELADLMLQAPDETERTVVRLAQMARATGIHLVVATQRPSTDIVTGLIKANFPARISFAVASSIDSRVILDGPGAESLLGRGDMLFLGPEVGTLVRLQGCYVTDKEVDRIVSYWREQMEAEGEEAEDAEEAAAEGEVEVAGTKPALAPWDAMLARESVIEDKDRQIEQAIEIIKKYGTASASLLQRKMRIGYPRAARLMDELKEMGIIGREQTGGKTREVFVQGDDDPIGRRAARIIGGEEDEAE
jgi:S-DNA-T family DNA segregation ATPase FtsK/SpoIIIE